MSRRGRRRLENTRFWSPLSLSKEQKHDIADPRAMARAADALPIDQVAKRWIVGCEPDEVVSKIAEYVGWGFNHLVFHAPRHDQSGSCRCSNATSLRDCGLCPRRRPGSESRRPRRPGAMSRV
nr:hypothetical protein [Microbacterium sp. zg.Y818]